jgi:proteasome lid subunit RPN8/RPN11
VTTTHATHATHAANNVLYLPSGFVKQIEAEGAAAYPNECCGIMFGRDERDGGITRRIVQRIEPVKNAFEADEQYHRFSISPQQLMAADRVAGENGELVLGFYHSHPDHPARPSEYDRQHAWPFYSYVIVAIHKREPVDMTSWLLNEQTEVFARQEIVEALESGPLAESQLPDTRPGADARPAPGSDTLIEPLEGRDPL